MDENGRRVGPPVKRSFQFLWPYLHRYRRGFTLGFGALAAKAILGAALPLAIRGGIDALTGGRGLKTVAGFCALLILVSICKGLFQYWMRVILIGISRDIEYDLRNDLFSKLVTLDAEFYGRMRTGDILARATNDMNAVRMMLGPGVMYWFETSLTLVLSVTVMSMVDWRLTLVALIPAPLVTIAVLGFGQDRGLRRRPTWLVSAGFGRVQPRPGREGLEPPVGVVQGGIGVNPQAWPPVLGNSSAAQGSLAGRPRVYYS